MTDNRVTGGLLLAALLGSMGLSAYAARPAQAVAGSPAVQAASLTTVDWNDFTYTSSCYSSKPRRFVARHGVAQVAGIHFQVYPPLFGDLTGDGRPEALVPYSCTGADFGGVHLFVFTGAASHPRLLAEIPSPTAPYVGSMASVRTVTLPVVTVMPQQRVLQVNGAGYSATAPHTCPDLDITLRYQVSRDHLIAMGSTVRHSRQCLSL